MKRIIAIILTLILCLAAFVACTPKDANNDVENNQVENNQEDQNQVVSDLQYIKDKGTLVVGITDYAPMNYRDENGEWTGFDTEFTKLVCEKLGVTAEFIEIDWDSKILELDSKAIDCVWNGMTLTNEVKNSMNCSVPYVVNAQVVVMDKAKLDSYKSVESIADLTFVAEAGSAGQSALAAIGYEAVEVQTQADALMEVAAGAEDACVIDITMANAMTGEGTSYENLGYSIALTEEEYGIGFRKDSDVKAEVDKIIAELVQDGSLTALAEKYQLTLTF